MSSRITTVDVARMAKVNQSTVSRALNPATAGMISRKRRKQILSICDKLGFRPSVSARSVATGKTYKVGLILGSMEWDMSDPEFTFFVKTLCDDLQQSSYTLALIHVDDSAHPMSEEVRRVLMSETADAYVLGATMLKGQTVDFLRRLSRPLITIYTPIPSYMSSFSNVSCDYAAALRDVWRRIPEEWVSRIAFFGRDNEFSRDKIAKIKAAASDVHLDASGMRILLYGDERKPFFMALFEGFSHAAKMLRKLEGIRFVWCSNDFGALGLCNVLRMHGIEPGRDIFLVSHGNLERFPGFVQERFLSTIDHRPDKLADAVCELAMRLIDDPTPQKVLIQGEYISRKSFPNSQAQSI